MMAMPISDMNRRLQEINSFFNQQTALFQTVIGRHDGKITSVDHQEFETLLSELRQYVQDRISLFIDQKFRDRCDTYEVQIERYSQKTREATADLNSFRQQLQLATVTLKQTQNSKETLLEHFSKRFSENLSLKKGWKLLNNYRKQRQLQKLRDQEADQIYQKNLIKKAFFPWRTLTYKEGYENTVRRETQRDMLNIHQQYQSIIDILKIKISEADEVVRVKKAAKGEFAYALSKNLLKTISNLSLEVMSLNQMSLRDGEADEQSTRKFMNEVDVAIKDKLSKVRQYRKGLLEDNEENAEEDGQKQRKKITFA